MTVENGISVVRMPATGCVSAGYERCKPLSMSELHPVRMAVPVLSAVKCSTPVRCKSRKPKMLKKRNRKKTLKKIAREFSNLN
jgi:hypothetical protein